MATSAPNKEHIVRAAAVLTTGEVAGTTFDLNNAWGSCASAQIDFTLGSLTNGIFRFYVSMDASTWYPLADAGGAVVSYTFTADTTRAIPLSAVGWKHLRISVQGTGTVTSSSAAMKLRYLRRGSQ